MNEPDNNNNYTGLEIAVIGMAVRFPGARNIDEFWENLKNGIESISFFSEDELKEAGVEEHVLLHPDYVKAMGFLDGIDAFDANFFEYTPIEVEVMDPQIRLFHEITWEALEDAAVVPDTYDGLIGLYAGASDSFYWKGLAVLSGKDERFGQFELDHLTNRDFLCSRAAYKFNLKGPVVYVQTACSTSLTAIHLASQGLLSGEADIALAGGVTVNPFKSGYVYQEGMILSPDGHCRTFDRGAKGTVGGNGAGIVVLKRLEDAIENKNHIYAIIKGSAINNDGKQKMGYTAPSVEGQSEAIQDALQTARVEEESIDYIEAHGTGTTLGDPVEIEALKLAFKTNKKGYCGLGSIKTNFGHMDNAAGAAGFIKTALALKHHLIPPSLHFETPNPAIDFIDSPFYINTGAAQWEKGKSPRRAGVSSLGIGGTNVHVILEEAQGEQSAERGAHGEKRIEHGALSQGRGGVTPPYQSRENQLIVLSAKTPTALDKIAADLVEYLKKHPGVNLSHVAYTLQQGRKAFKYRRTTICASVEEAIKTLSSLGTEKIHNFIVSDEPGNEPDKQETGPEDISPGIEQLKQIGQCWGQGEKIDWQALYPDQEHYWLSLPTYPFERQQYRVEGDPLTLGAELFSKRSSTNKKPGLAGWFYLPSWKRVGPVEPIKTKDTSTGLCWLVFIDNCGLGAQLEKQLETEGEVVVIVEPGPGYRKINDRHFTIHPRQEKDYEILVHELVRQHHSLDRVVHLWGITPVDHKNKSLGVDRINHALDNGFYSLINMAKAIGKQGKGMNNEIRLTAVTNHMQEVTGGDGFYPEKAVILGPIKIIPTEYINIVCQVIDLEFPLSGAVQEKKLICQLKKELKTGTPGALIAYRGGYQWKQTYEPRSFEAANQQETILKQKGIYLVTGGLGGIGLVLAQHLATCFQAKLVLTGRTPFPVRDQWEEWLNTPGKDNNLKQKIQKLKELEGLGAELLICCADTANPQQMQHVIAQTREHFGPINGIIHCAGLADGEMIQPRTPGASERIFTAKITGTLVLDKLLKANHKALDFFLLCSSITAILPVIGQVGYCAANAFLDAYAHYQNTFDNHYVTMSINWDRWQKTGIAAIAETYHKELTGEDLTGGITREQGIEIFSLIMANKAPQVIVSTLDLTTLPQQAFTFNPASFKQEWENKPTQKTLRQRPGLRTKYMAPRTPTQEKLEQIWENFFGYQQLGTRDDFFELGGDSLKVLLLLPKIHQELGVNISIPDFFNCPTIEKLSAHIDGAETSVYETIEPIEKKEYYPLSSAQKRLYLLQQMDPDSTTYNIPQAIPLEKHVETHKIESILRQLVARHESLRTCFEMVDEEPVQRIHEEVEFEIEYYDFQVTGEGDRCRWEEPPFGQDLHSFDGHSPKSQELRAKNFINSFIRPFDLLRAPLLRSGIIELPGGSRVWTLDIHHIVSDAMSQDILTRDFISLDSGQELASPKLQYKDFSQWQNRLFASGELDSQEKYWLELYMDANELPRLNLTGDHKRPEVFTFAGGHYEFVLEKETTQKFKDLGTRKGATLFMNILAVMNILFYKYTGQTDIIIGSGTAGRPHTDLQPIMGMFVNTLAIRCCPVGEKSYGSFLKEVINQSIAAFENQDLQFEALVDKLDLERDPSRNPLFDISLVFLDFDNTGEPKQTHQPLLFTNENFYTTPYQNPASRFDMTFFVLEPSDEIYINIEYYTGIFNKETIQRLASHFQNIIQAVIKEPDLKIKDIEILSREELHQVLYDFNDTGSDYPKDKTIHDLFVRQVEQNPDHVALVAQSAGRRAQSVQSEEKHPALCAVRCAITYKELNEKSGQLAYLLTEKGVRTDTIVAIMIERSIEMIIGILGILKAGGAYLPIDANYPQDRINYMLNDSAAKILLSAGHHPDLPSSPLPSFSHLPIFPSSQLPSFSHLHLSPWFNAPATPLAYIMYTSGTTGRPKGVMVTRQNVIRLVKEVNYFDFVQGKRLLLTGTITFDITTFEIWGVLLNGLILYLVDQTFILEPGSLKHILFANKINILHLVPQLFNQIAAQDLEIFSRLDYLLVGGDVVTPVYVNKLRNKFKAIKILHMYGPTENTTFSSFYPIERTFDIAIPIGKPVSGSYVYIVDCDNKPQPIGIPGELLVGGHGVAQGYLNNPGQTNEKFDQDLWDCQDYWLIKNYKLQNTMPLSIKKAGAKTNTNHKLQITKKTAHELYESTRIGTISNKKLLRGVQGGSFLEKRPPGRRRQNLYKTGDLGRWHPDGNIEFLGRIDQQVKIRGHRIEPGEIELQLLKHDLIIEAVVLDRKEESGDKYLCGYIVPKEPFDLEELKEILSRSLPSYMIPGYFVSLEKIPLTANGKLDRKMLPEPGIRTETAAAVPGTQLEKQLAQVWAEVLGQNTSTIGIDDNFFHLGGHSLKAAVLIAKIHKEIGVKVPLTEIFKNQTIRELASYTAQAQKTTYADIIPIEKKEYYALSSAQERLYFLQQMDLNGIGYNMPMVLPLGKEINKNKLESVFKQLIARHESLRTWFEIHGEEPVQRIHDEVEFEMEYYDTQVSGALIHGDRRRWADEGTRGLAPLPIESATRDTQPATALISSFISAFDLSRAPLIRSGLIKLSGGNHNWMIDMHHIISDGTSHTILMEDFLALYQAQPLESLPIQYKDFALWQNRLLASQQLKSQAEYWHKLYADRGEIPRLLLPADFKRPGVYTFAGDNYDFILEPGDTARLKVQAIEKFGTLYMNIFAALNTLFYKYTGQEDIIMGSGTAGRTHSSQQRITGMFVNTLAIRNYPHGEKNYETFLEEVIIANINALENQDIQFEELVNQLDLERDTSRNPLFDICIIARNFRQLEKIVSPLYPLDKNQPAPAYKNTTAKFDLTFYMDEQEEGLYMNIEYYTAVFKKETIQQLEAHFKNVIKTVINNPGTRLKDIEIISPEEKQQVLETFNDTATEYPRDKLIHELFEEQAEQNPDHIELLGGSAAQEKHQKNYNMSYMSYLSYKELNKQSNQMARLLEEKRVGPGTLVGIMVERSIEMIVGILGILKAGGAYLPIDPEYPPERIYVMLKDSSAKVLLVSPDTQVKVKAEVEGRSEQLQELPPRFINVETVYGTAFEPYTLTLTSNSTCQVSSANMAYVIYTSGTTGRPKGVVVTQQNVVRLVKNTNYIEFKPHNRLLPTGALGFDASTFEIWGALLNGIFLCQVSKDVILTASQLKENIRRHGITIMWMTSPLFNQMLEADIGIFASLRYLLVGGDVLSPVHINSLTQEYPGMKVINGYGPTENTTFSTTFLINGTIETNIPIGQPIANSTVYILNKDMQPQPIGIPGEITVGGHGVARGYLNNPELTNEKFDQDLWDCQDYHDEHELHELTQIGTTSNKKLLRGVPDASRGSFLEKRPPGRRRLFKTGDLGRWHPNGNIEFLGRKDRQVKIRGFRIELEEIQLQLWKHDRVKEALVLARQDKNDEKYLCAYIVPRGSFDPEELKEYLAAYLPSYMVPMYIVPLEKVPLTANGKPDIKKLPAPAIRTGVAETVPRTQLEKKLAGIWAETLGLKIFSIGREDNFFHLGGHSLKATVLTAKIQKEMQVNIPLTEVFKYPTLGEMANFAAKTQKITYTSINPQEKKEYYDLSSAQKRLYFLHLATPGIAYNMPLVIALDKNIKKDKLSAALQQLIDRHESLRTSFTMKGDEPVQRIHDEVEFEMEYYDMQVTGALIHGDRCRWEDEGTRGLAPLKIEFGTRNPQPATALISSFIRPFDLGRAPLLRSSVIRLPDNNHIWMIDMHHIISDGTSHMILKQDFLCLYHGQHLEPQPIQYKDFAHWQNQQFEKKQLKAQEAYWLGLYADCAEIPGLALPIDYNRPDIFTYAGKHYDFTLPAGETVRFKTLGTQQEGTLFMNILAILNTLFYKYTNQTDIIIGSVTAGRPHSSLQGIIGMFVNTLAIRNYPNGEKTYETLLKEVINNSIEALSNQEIPFEELVGKLPIERDTSRNPLFDVCMAVDDFSPGEQAGKGLIQDNKHHLFPTIGYETNTAKFDISFSIQESDQHININIEYYQDIFKPDTIKRMATHFKNIIKAVIKNPGIRLKDIDILSLEEHQQLLDTFNNTKLDYPRDKMLHELFVRQVEQTPDHVALAAQSAGRKAQSVERDEKHPALWAVSCAITYNELNEKSDQLAYLLKEKGIRAGSIVAIKLERSIEMITGLLGILKAGGAYLPIDINYPQNRIDYMLKDSGAEILLKDNDLTPEAFNNRPKGTSSRLHLSPWFNAPATPLAYIIYTSGTTGRPKGIIVEHRNVVAYIYGYYHEFDINAKDIIPLLASVSFDAFVEEVYPMMLRGGKVVICPREVLMNLHWLSFFLVKQQVTILACVPQLLNELNQPDILDKMNIRLFSSGADVLKKEYISNIRGKGMVYNVYGPTETTVGATFYRLPPNESDKIPIGKPIANTRIYILDKHLKLVPIMVSGEICIGGHGATRGYLNNPELTLEKFDHDLWDYQDYHNEKEPSGQIINSFGGKKVHELHELTPIKTTSNQKFLRGGPGGAVFSKSAPPGRRRQKIYKTGDLGRWQADGNIEFCGRIDQQVKIRGYRIELGEIERHLTAEKEINEAIVRAIETRSGAMHLCAYIVSGRRYETNELKKSLTRVVPQYMIPTYFIQLDRIPLSPNGKVDRKALPPPAASDPETAVTYIAPRSEIEAALAVIWAELLGIPDPMQISIDDNFFRLGGDSLKAARAAAGIYHRLGVNIPVLELFKAQTIRELAQWIKESYKQTRLEIHPQEKKEYYELSFNQKRMWILHQKAPNKNAFNMPDMFIIPGETQETRILQTVKALIQKHESLRTGFKEVNGKVVQYIEEPGHIPLEYIDISNQETQKQTRIKSLINDLNLKPFQLEKPPLIRSLLIKVDNRQYIFAYIMHHIISDGWSVDILESDFQQIYQDIQQGRENPDRHHLVKITYKDFAHWHNRQMEHGNTKKISRQFWERFLKEELPVLRLPRDIHYEGKDKAGARHYLFISRGIRDILTRLSQKHNITLFTFLYSLYTILLSLVSGQAAIVTIILHAGRDNPLLQNIVGFFINTILFKTVINWEESFIGIARHIQERVREFFQHQDYPLELVLEETGLPYPEISTAFNMLNIRSPGTSTRENQKNLDYEMPDIKFDLEPFVSETQDGIEINVIYNKNIFAAENIEYMMNKYQQLIEFFAWNPDKRLKDFKEAKKRKSFKRAKGETHDY